MVVHVLFIHVFFSSFILDYDGVMNVMAVFASRFVLDLVSEPCSISRSLIILFDYSLFFTKLFDSASMVNIVLICLLLVFEVTRY